MNDSLQEKLNQTTERLAVTGEEKVKYEKLADKLEKERNEVEAKSQQQETEINQLQLLQEVCFEDRFDCLSLMELPDFYCIFAVL